MKKSMIAALVAAALAAALPQPGQANDVAAAIAAGAIGVAVGASLSKHSDHHHHGNAFSPEAGITCHPKQRACYHDNGGFAAGWTRQIYG